MPSDLEEQTARLEACLDGLHEALTLARPPPHEPGQTGASEVSAPREHLLASVLERLLAPVTLALAQARAAEQEHERLRRADVATLSELVTHIAHELNQPLAAVVTNAQASGRWLGHQPPNLEEALLSVRSIAEDAQRASQVIARVRARLQGAATPRVRVRVGALLREVADTTQQRTRARPITLQVRCDDDVPDLLADLPQLQRVLRELVDNALDAMTESVDRQLTLSAARSEHGDVQIGVSDSGPGLPLGQRERVFEPLHSTKASHLGLGLTVCRSFIRAHGGRLWASANADGGETLLFCLPGTAADS